MTEMWGVLFLGPFFLIVIKYSYYKNFYLSHFKVSSFTIKHILVNVPPTPELLQSPAPFLQLQAAMFLCSLFPGPF